MQKKKKIIIKTLTDNETYELLKHVHPNFAENVGLETNDGTGYE